MRIEVANTAEETDSSCHTDIAAKCEVHYSLRYTPILYDTVSNQVYWDQEINFVLNAIRANHNMQMNQSKYRRTAIDKALFATV